MPVKHTWKVHGETRIGIINMGKAVKENCEDCSESKHDAIHCHIETCPLWPFRRGKDSGRKRNLTDDQKRASAERLKKARERKNATL